MAATDAAGGEAVVLTRGGLVDALRASMTVPLLFPPVAVDGRRLVGGVVSDPLPLAAASDARAVIALALPRVAPQRADRPSRLLAQVGRTLVDNLMQVRTAAARAAGQRVLHVELALERRVGPWQIGALNDLFEAGRRAAQAQLPQIVTMLEGRALRAVA